MLKKRILLGTIGLMAVALSTTPAQTLGLPAGATITEAKLSLYVTQIVGATANPIKVTLHRITRPGAWTEGSLTWNNFMGAPGSNPGHDDHLYSPIPAGSADISATGWVDFDIRRVVQCWVDGNCENTGLVMLHPRGDQRLVHYASSENSNTALIPKVFIRYMDGRTSKSITITGAQNNFQDQYVWEAFPDYVNGDHNLLYTGYCSFPTRNPYVVKKSMFRWDLPLRRPLCTFTPGYWKNHANPRQKKYDDTWDLVVDVHNSRIVGAKATFLNADPGKVTWMDALSTPTRGNAFWTLARAFAAAKLNMLKSGGQATKVDAELATAERLLRKVLAANGTRPVIRKKSPDRPLALRLANVLDRFNNGL